MKLFEEGVMFAYESQEISPTYSKPTNTANTSLSDLMKTLKNM